MTVTTEETLTANGVVLNTLAYNVASLTGRLRVPPKRGGNVSVPGRHGALRVAHKPFDQNEIVLPMWVLGADVNGAVPAYGDPLRKLLFDNVDTLTRIFGSDAVELVHTLPDGSQRRVLGEVTEAIDFTSMAGGTRAEFAVTLVVPGAFWTDVSDQYWVSESGLVDEQVLTIPPFEGGTAPLDDGVYVVHGPGDNPELTAHATGAYVRYQGSLAVGEDWRVDAAAWTSVVGTDIGFGGPGTNVIADTIHGGSARLLELPALAPGDPAIQIGVQNFGAETQIEARGRRKYLIG